MSERLKLYHYCYYTDLDKNNRTDQSYISKAVDLVTIVDDEIINPKWSKQYDICDDDWYEEYFDPNDGCGCFMFDYFTFDDLHGYERFIETLLRRMSQQWIVTAKRLKEAAKDENKV